MPQFFGARIEVLIATVVAILAQILYALFYDEWKSRIVGLSIFFRGVLDNWDGHLWDCARSVRDAFALNHNSPVDFVSPVWGHLRAGFFAAILADSLALPFHWAEGGSIEEVVGGAVRELFEPSEMLPMSEWHDRRSRGDQTVHGELFLMSLDFLSTRRRFRWTDLRSSFQQWAEAVLDENIRPESVTRALWNFDLDVRDATTGNVWATGSLSTSASAVVFSLPVLAAFPLSFQREALIGAVRETASLISQFPPCVEGAEFIARLVSRFALEEREGGKPKEPTEAAARAVLEEMGNPVILLDVLDRASRSAFNMRSSGKFDLQHFWRDDLTGVESACPADTLERTPAEPTHCFSDDIEAVLSAVLFLAIRHEGNLDFALVSNTMLGGEQAVRGLILGMVMGSRESPGWRLDVRNLLLIPESLESLGGARSPLKKGHAAGKAVGRLEGFHRKGNSYSDGWGVSYVPCGFQCHSAMRAARVVTGDVEVVASSRLAEDRKREEQARIPVGHAQTTDEYFEYQVAVINKSSLPIRFASRHWVIVSGDGNIEQVIGDGVGGGFSTVRPGERFSYVSYSPVRNSPGYMMGTFTVTEMGGSGGGVPGGSVEGGRSFDLMVGPFALEPSVSELQTDREGVPVGVLSRDGNPLADVVPLSVGSAEVLIRFPA
uniref:ApaG domain-containing protein n=1 Tax=Chromera velia CCMP2878 TaxID=1169474 RepID=A0A0G4HI97_9ALVE|eukprot:Cvel_27845.t1-p1 / transcript=Cvel_27845.t1 / gene=Cvel_27845 / organism=Chromera_velia_CCMP2878 / gene_product=Protein ApaG, putative / transcript_product=Protein ApaG, putative / location=Cvel_scaffold3542:553-2538(-) / protein_length=662 / sequence_SO=supercontig / SO=protein_coding / is_pseudo=false